jgi:hypothetical protein
LPRTTAFAVVATLLAGGGCAFIATLEDHAALGGDGSPGDGSPGDGSPGGDSGGALVDPCDGAASFCKDNVPPGARLVAYSLAGGSCPDGFGHARTLVAVPSATDCSCGCNRTSAETCNAVVLNDCPPTLPHVFFFDGGPCLAASGTFPNGTGKASVSASAGGCAVSYDAGGIAAGVACEVLGEACNGAGCATAAPSPFHLCVSGVTGGCPGAFPTPIVVGARVVSDTRCTAGCTCTANASGVCSDASVTVSSDGVCGKPSAVTLTTACGPAPTSYGSIGVTHAPSTDAGCTVDGVATRNPEGGVTLGDTELLCCR